MALSKQQVALAVKAAGIQDKAYSVYIALRVLRELLKTLPWWKRVFVTLKALVGGLEEYLLEESDDDA